MRIEAVRMSAAAAMDAAIGINAMIAALPIEAGDTRPDNVTVYHQFQQGADWIGRKAIPEKGSNIQFPAVVIWAQPSSVDQVMTSVRDAEIPVVFTYLTRKAVTIEAELEAAYVNRAILRFLSRLANPAAEAFRVRNGVQLLNPTGADGGIRQGETEQKWESAMALAATEITWRVRETEA